MLEPFLIGQPGLARTSAISNWLARISQGFSHLQLASELSCALPWPTRAIQAWPVHLSLATTSLHQRLADTKHVGWAGAAPVLVDCSLHGIWCTYNCIENCKPTLKCKIMCVMLHNTVSPALQDESRNVVTPEN